MTLDELKALWDAAVKALEAAPEDADLKAKADEAQAAYEAKKAEEVVEEVDESKLDEKTKSYLAKLRKENASHRTKNKDLKSELKSKDERTKAILKAAGIEVEDEKPEEKIKSLTAQTQEKDFQLAVLQSAVANGIPGDALEFYEFLIRKATSTLEEGDELSEDALKDIVAKAKKQGKTAANTSVGDGKGGNPPPPGASAGLTLEAFCRMSMVEKSELFTKDQATYNKLMQEAKSKKKLV